MAVLEGRDDRGGQTRIETGIGRIEEVKPKGERNAQVIITAEHLREPVSCWVDRQGPVWPRVEKAQAENLRVWYHVVVHRKAKTDPELLIAQVEKRDKVRDLVGLRRDVDAPSDDELRAAVGAIDEAPAAAAPVAPAGNGFNEAAAARLVAGQAPTAAPAAAGADASPAAGSNEESKFLWLEKLDSAVKEGRPRSDIDWLIRSALEVGCSQRSIDAVIRARREHDRVAAGSASPGPDVAAAALNDGEEGAGVTRIRGRAPDDEWTVPAGVHPAAAQALVEKTGSDSPAVAKAAEDRLRQLGVARVAFRAAADPDRVAGEAPPAAAPEPGHDRPARPVAAVSGLSRRSQPVASDSKPWEFTNSDGRINLGSYAAGAVLELTNLAGRLLITRARNRASEDPTYELKAPTAEQVHALAQTLLSITDRIQHLSRDGGRVDRMSSSHRVARQALREGLDLYPVPWGSPSEEVEAWREDLVTHGTTILDVVLALLEGRQPTGAAVSGA